MSLLDSPEGQRAARLLEWPTLLEEIAAHASLERGAERVRALVPVNDAERLDTEWAHLAELTTLLTAGLDLPLASMFDLEAALSDEARRSGPLEPAHLAGVGAAALNLSDLLEYVAARAERLPLTARKLDGSEDPRPIGEHLQAALEPDGRIKDSASPPLRGLRRALEGARSRVRDAAQSAMQRALRAGWCHGEALVERDGRYCVPLKSGRRGQMPGIVHDRSATGNTLFVEPLPVVEASSELQEAQLAVSEEERRIIATLNEQLRPHVPGLLALHARAVALDALRARARWGARRSGKVPRLEPAGSGRLKLPGFRHPLLWSSLERSGDVATLVPLAVELDPADRVLLISGPNAGGKTVALKAVGLAQLMAQAVIPLPCQDEAPRLSLCDRVLMDVGDEQSIADALSSFSAHVTHLRNILDEATEASLVLLDEVGGGTDPEEGVALARAVLEHLAQHGVRTFATTHYGQLKALVHHAEGLRNASMAYDQEQLRPRFSLVLDIPGSSHALEIATRLGLPEDVLRRARELVGEESLSLTAILAELEAERDRIHAARAEAEELRERHRQSQERYESLHRELRQNRRDRLNEAEREAEGIVRNARKRIERLLQQLRESGGGDDVKEVAARARQEVDEAAQRLRTSRDAREHKASARPFTAVEGELARHRGLDKVGRVLEVRGGKVTLDLAGRRLVAAEDELVDPGDAADPTPAPREGTVLTDLAEPAGGDAVTRIDVRGRDTAEAWGVVDKALDRCVLSGIETLEVIHGKGTGALRRALTERLREDQRVREAVLGGGGRFDDGVTVVRI